MFDNTLITLYIWGITNSYRNLTRSFLCNLSARFLFRATFYFGSGVMTNVFSHARALLNENYYISYLNEVKFSSANWNGIYEK